MSQFSAGYHLRTENQATAIKLIKDSGNTGYVCMRKRTVGRVTFLIEGVGFSIDRDVIACNPGLLVHYIYAEDHGWELRIYNKDAFVFEYGCDWTDDIQITKSVFDLELIQESFGPVYYEWVSADYMDPDELDEGVTYVD